MTEQAKPKPANAGKNLPGRAVTLPEVREMILLSGASPSGLRNSAFLALTFGAGLRCAEALAVKPGDFERKTDGVTLTITRGKGGKTRRVTILPEFLPVVDRWLDCRKNMGITGHAPIICGITAGDQRANFGKPLSTVQMRATIARMAKKAGLTHRVHVHGMRHGHATLLAEHGRELRLISAQLGHSNCSITDRYLAKLSPAELLRSVGTLQTAHL